MITSVIFGVVDKDAAKQVRAVFFRAREGTEPVREWLRSMPKEDRRQVGLDIKTVEYGWPIGMPTCRSLGEDLWEVRTKLPDREVRISFFLKGTHMILTHGFVKKERLAPLADLRLARDRKRQWEGARRDK